MADLRTPRGFAVDRPQFKELCEGVRPNSQLVRLKAYTGLTPVRIDQYHHDPIVIDAGTLIGIVTGSLSAAGAVVPALISESGNAELTNALGLVPHSDGATWGLPTTSGTLDVGPFVKPIGVCYKPIYSFHLETQFTNYKREHTVPFLTDYVIQIPAIQDEEHAIREGDLVMLGTGEYTGPYASIRGATADVFTDNVVAGRYAKFSSTAINAQERVVGRCIKRLALGTGTATAGTELGSDANFAISTAASDEFRALSKVQTVPGLNLSGSGTGGIPGHLTGARSDSSGNYVALTILIRL